MVAVWAIGASAKSSAAPVGSGKASATKAVCGMGTGKKATGAPIKIGALNMLIPGVDFTTVAKVANDYFQCVNDNGGINGRPIQYIQYTEDLNPTHEAALATKLVESDKVVGIVGNTSFGECGTNWKYYQSKGFIVLGAGVQAECYSTPSYAEIEHGPALQQHERRAVPARARREVARHRLAEHAVGVRRRLHPEDGQGTPAFRTRSSRRCFPSPTRTRSSPR